MTTILIISSDPHLIAMIGALAPPLSVSTAHDAMTALTRLRHRSCRLIIVDLRMTTPYDPTYDSLILITHIRVEHPHRYPFSPHDDAMRRRPLLAMLGCAAALAPGMNRTQCAAHIHAALTPPPPLTAEARPWVDYHYAKALDHERRMRRRMAHDRRVYVLGSTEYARQRLLRCMTQLQAPIADSAHTLVDLLIQRDRASGVIVADQHAYLTHRSQIDAVADATLVVATHLQAAYRVHATGVAVVLERAPRAHLADALRATLHGRPYLDATLTAPLDDAPLTQAERDLAPFLLSGLTPHAIAERCNVTRSAVYKHRKHIWDKLGVTSMAEFWAYLDACIDDQFAMREQMGADLYANAAAD